LGMGDWGLGPIPKPQSPIPNPQSPLQQNILIYLYIKNKLKKLNQKNLIFLQILFYQN